ncbi:MAG: murein biosynthesis integral membrane protein MurJ [Ilumatobacteraceae bacterium]
MSGLFKSNVIVALGTALSRLTGLLRVAVFAIVVGQTALADAYNSANNSPNAMYELLLGGVLSASLVPMFTRQAEDDDDEATSAVVSVAALALTALTIVAVGAAPFIFHLFSIDVAQGVDPDEYRRVGTALARIFLIQVFFYGMTALGTALLQARRRYFAAAWSPVLSNIVIIGGLLLVPSTVDGREPQLVEVLVNDRLRWTLGLGATFGIATMALALMPALRSAEVSLVFRPNLRHPAVRQLISLSTWTLGYVVANQVAIVVVQNLAEPGSGNVNAYALAYIFFVLPHGLLAMSIVTTFTPEMASAVARRDRDAFIDRTSMGIRLVALLTFPAAVAMFVLRRPLIGLALQHGNFDASDALVTSRALAGFALGLGGFSIYLFALRAFYSHGDARTPFVINLFENAINIVLAVVLVRRYGVLGLGAAFAVAYIVSSVWALYVVRNKVRGFTLPPIAAACWRMGLAALVAGEVMWFVAREVGGNAGTAAVARVAAAGIVGLGAYVALLAALGVDELTQLRDRVRARFA